MNNKINLIIIVLIYIFNTQSVYSQDNGKNPIGDDDEYTKLIPPSPTAYELGKYGQIPVGYFTGTPSVSVPIYTYKAGKLSVPISLSYNSNGIKVDQLSSNVGLGWSLNVGGVITRIVKDEPDEESYQYFPESEIEEARSPLAMEYFTIAANNADLDTEADVFMYNFMGYSGKFVYNNDKGIVLMPARSLQIEPFIIENSTEFGYRITTADGVIYEFSEIEKTKSFNTVQSKNRTPNIPLTTAWYLSKITHPTGDQINFIYESTSYDYDNSIEQQYHKSFWGGTCGAANNLITYKNSSHIICQRISQINSNKNINGRVDFQYNVNHPSVIGYKLISGIAVYDANNSIIEDISLNYTPTSNNRIFLSNLTYEDPTKQYRFEYIDPESLCERLSYSQDYWGYYNGVYNQYFLPTITDHQLFIDSPYAGDREPDNQFAQKGLLKHITYPTKGFNEFEYEANTYYDDNVAIYPPPTNLHLEVYAIEYGGDNDIKTTNPIMFDQEVIINSSVWFDNSAGCGQVGDPTAYFQIRNLTTSNLINISKRSGSQPWNSVGTKATVYHDQLFEFKVSFEEGHRYEVELWVSIPCYRAVLTMHYFDGVITYEGQNIETGGSRIKRIIAKDPIADNIDTTSYYYNQYSNRYESSGEMGAKGYYISNRIERIPGEFPCEFEDCERYVLGSNSFIPLFNTGNNNIYYKYVTVSKGGDNFRNGGETHEFKIHRDSPGYPLVGNGFTQSPASWTNFGWDNGLEESVRTFKIENNQIKTVSLLTNNYINDERMSDTVYSYAITKNFDLSCYPLEIFHTCTDEDISWSKEVKMCTADHNGKKHIYFVVALLTAGYVDRVCIRSGAINESVTLTGPCNGHDPGDIVQYYDALENLNVIEYMNLSSWNYLSSSTLREYDTDNNGEIVKTTNYYYDNPQHLQVSRIEKTESIETTESQMYYPEDYDEGLFTNLVANNITSVPIDQRTIYNGKLQKGRLIHYNDIGQPVDIYNAEDEKGTTLVFSSNNPYSYANGVKKKILEYDPTSNTLRSYKNEDDMETTILWGYNYSKPVAKIENADFASVDAALEVTYAVLQTKTSNELKEIINNLRTHSALENTMITSYTYDPLIGMTSTTDPNGYITHYVYDSFGRLQTIRDFDWNVIKHFNYNYHD